MGWANSVEVYLDTDLDRRSYYQLAFDMSANVWDAFCSAAGKQDFAWNATLTAAAGREASAWTSAAR